MLKPPNYPLWVYWLIPVLGILWVASGWLEMELNGTRRLETFMNDMLRPADWPREPPRLDASLDATCRLRMDTFAGVENSDLFHVLSTLHGENPSELTLLARRRPGVVTLPRGLEVTLIQKNRGFSIMRSREGPFSGELFWYALVRTPEREYLYIPQNVLDCRKATAWSQR